MPTIDLQPNGVVTIFRDFWTNVGGASKWQSLEDSNDATYIWHATINQRQDINVETISEAGVVSADVHSVDAVDWVGRGNRPGGANSLIVGSTVDQAGTYYDMTAFALNAAITDHTVNSFKNPHNAGSATWTYTHLNTGFDVTHYFSAASTEVRVHKSYVNVTYTLPPASGGFAIFIASLLPPILAVASHGLDVPVLQKILVRSRPHPCREEEWRRLLEAVLVRPRYLCLR